MATEIPRNRARFTLDEAVSATGGLVALKGRAAAEGVTTDTRADLQGTLFVALSGERFDAHHFLQQAVDGGAHLLVVEARAESTALVSALAECPLRSRPSVLIVDETLSALGDLAAAHRRRHQVRLLTVAGSAGKTTTRSVTSALMNVAAPGRVLSTQGNLNNRIGVPMTLFGLTSSHRYAVLELGTNRPGEIPLLAEMCAADVAILTLIDLEHTEGLGDLDGVEREEAAVFSRLSAEGVAIGYGEDERVRRSVEHSDAPTRLCYGLRPECELRIVGRSLTPTFGAQLVLERSDATRLEFATSLIGRAGALAAAAGVLGAEALLDRRLTDDECRSALLRVGEAGRHQVLSLPDGRVVVDDSYNSNPASVPLSIAVGQELCELTGGRLWLVLGEMLELGQLSCAAHRKMGQLASESGAAGAFFVGGDAREAAEVARGRLDHVSFFEDAGEVAGVMAPLLKPGDVTVVKASRGVRAERVVEGLTAWFQQSPPGCAVSE